MRVELVDAAPREGAAYVDAEWTAAGADPVAALVVVDAESDDRADRAAARALLCLAARAAREVGGARPVDVVGGGFVAGAVRALLGAADTGDGTRPAAVVDTTGDPERIREALSRLDDLGTLVLAGELAEGALELDLYPDVHVRGLRIVGVPLDPEGSLGADELPAAALAYAAGVPPVAAATGAPLPPAAWYRLR